MNGRRRIPKISVTILLKAAAGRQRMRHGCWGYGENVYYIGHLNQDLYGQRIIAEFAEAGVDTSQVVFSDEMITPGFGAGQSPDGFADDHHP